MNALNVKALNSTYNNTIHLLVNNFLEKACLQRSGIILIGTQGAHTNERLLMFLRSCF